jgi:hypothetical protein
MEGTRQFWRLILYPEGISPQIEVIAFTDPQGRNLRLRMSKAHSTVAQIKILFMS